MRIGSKVGKGGVDRALGVGGMKGKGVSHKQEEPSGGKKSRRG